MGELVRQARMRKGWLQADLASRLGIAPSYLSQIETGARKWPQDLIDPLSKLLGLSQVDMDVAAGLIEAPEKPTTSCAESSPAYDATDPRLRDYVERIARLTPSRDLLWFLEANVPLLEKMDREREG